MITCQQIKALDSVLEMCRAMQQNLEINMLQNDMVNEMKVGL